MFGKKSKGVSVTVKTSMSNKPEKSWDLCSAEFIDATAYPTPSLQHMYTKNNVRNYFLGFLTENNKRACWGGYDKLFDSNTKQEYTGDATVSDYMKSEISALRDKGGDVIVSFGGASNSPIESSRLTDTEVFDIYKKIIENYDLTHLDFDIEGSFLTDVTSQRKHCGAARLLQQIYPTLKLSYTLPVDGSKTQQGFNSDGVQLLKLLHDYGIKPSLINGMLMEFGNNPSCIDLGDYCIVGLKGMLKHVQSVFKDYTYAHLGACPMFGKNNNGKVFTLPDQVKLIDYCFDKDIGCVNGWDAVRDMNTLNIGIPNYIAGSFGKIISKYNRKV